MPNLGINHRLGYLGKASGARGGLILTGSPASLALFLAGLQLVQDLSRHSR